MSTSESLTSIYVIGGLDGPPYKVGFSDDPKSRLGTLQTASARTLVVHYSEETSTPKAKVIEKMIHRQLAPHRLRGEWFQADLDTVVAEVRFAFIRWDGEDNLAFRFKRRLV